MHSIDFSFIEALINNEQIKSIHGEIFKAHEKFHGNKVFEAIGWLNLPKEYDKKIIEKIINEAKVIRKNCLL